MADRYSRRRLMSASLVLAAAAALFASEASAAVELRFSPERSRVAVGETAELSVVLDDTMAVRTIEIWVRFDPDVVSSLDGSPGGIFAAAGCPLFPVFENEDPDRWYAGAVALGPECWAEGPGEIYRWTFTGAAEGVCPVTVDSVKIYDPQAMPIAGTTLGPAVINVGSLTGGVPAARPLSLSLHPNPFNPRTVLRCAGRDGERAAVEAFDAAGRLVAEIWSGRLGPAPLTVTWDGRRADGSPAAAGMYLFRLRGEDGRAAIGKGMLLK